MGNSALKSLVVPRYRLFAEDLGLTVGGAKPPKSTDTWACLFARWGGKINLAPPDGFDFLGKTFTRLKKAYRPRSLGWSNRQSPQNKFVLFDDFSVFLRAISTLLKVS